MIATFNNLLLSADICSGRIMIWYYGFATLQQKDCPDNFVKCESGDCINFSDVCDGTENCKDGSDEFHAICRNLNKYNVKGTFRCAYGALIEGERRCDGIQDCADNSDELLDDCPGSTWPNKQGSQSCNGNFQCRSGECVSMRFSCDGEVHCSDGSDESIEACYSFRCPENSFRCAYGGCILNTGMCDGKNNCADGSDEHYLLCNRTKEKFCTVPSIEGLSFRCKDNEDSASCVLRPGSLVKEPDIVNFHCEKGFGTNVGFPSLFCYNSTWNGQSDLHSLCLRACPPLKSKSTDFHCIQAGKTRDCSTSLPGTLVTARCKEGYSYTGIKAASAPNRQFQCLPNAQWEPFNLPCEKNCGILDPTLAAKNDEASLVARNPWNVGIYLKFQGKYEQFCSGTLISPSKVLTAASCIVHPIREESFRQKKKMRIALGKHHNSFQHSHDKNYQIREIAELIKPDNYLGSSNHYYNDVAIIKLASEVEISSSVMPICVDKGPLYKLSSNVHGSIVGWHLRSGSSSSILDQTRCTLTDDADRRLKSGRMPYVPRDECEKYLTSFLNFDKFCAFSPTGTDVTSVCNRDSGAGLTFNFNGVHYIYGIVTTLVNSSNIRNTNNFISTFTDLTDSGNLKFVLDNL
ncbi:modular serine protease isoform X1 [Nilaparvata lugens]|uniref:modular serine protease isoform X1 n=1 Tax=Nilaparvata lugens TaxID=108931 RepID=UPI00193D8079|nr:modular serine protease isoform X1 [Nilaparvata lugens]XP_039282378.1 modular serine protease isoform X1 [Nilaparvata lugens]